MVIFKFKQKKFEGNLKVRLWAKRLCTRESVKYLGVQIDSNLNWESQVNDLCFKLNRTNGLLFKIRKYVSRKILRSICFAILKHFLSYCCSLFWAQNFGTYHPTAIFQKKAVRIINFQPRNFRTRPSLNKALF